MYIYLMEINKVFSTVNTYTLDTISLCKFEQKLTNIIIRLYTPYS